MTSDEELVARVAVGSHAALEELLARYRRPLAAFLARHGAGSDLDDLFQDVWLRVVRSAAGFDRRRRFSSWLFTIAINRCRDEFARRKREPIGVADPDAVSATATPDGDRVDLTRLLDALGAEQREVVLLRYYADMSEAEMSEALGIPRGTVKSRLHAAMKALAARASAGGDTK